MMKEILELVERNRLAAEKRVKDLTKDFIELSRKHKIDSGFMAFYCVDLNIISTAGHIAKVHDGKIDSADSIETKLRLKECEIIFKVIEDCFKLNNYNLQRMMAETPYGTGEIIERNLDE